MKDNQKTARRTEPQNARPTIGLLTYGPEDPNNYVLWLGVDDVARERGANLICFPGNPLRSPRGFEAQANVLYDLVSAETVDGLVIWGGALGHHVSHEEIRIFCERYRPLPIVNIGFPLEGIPNVLADYHQGMRDGMLHLIEVHGYRRIAFIRGPEGHMTAEDRYRGYIDALAEHHIPLDPDLVAPGEFKKTSGMTAIDLLLDQRKASFEAVVAVDDDTAIGAMEALQARGISVPGDVAVVGFDNTEESRYVTPPLTTVPLLMYERGRRAAEMVLTLLAGEEASEQVILPMELMVRQSCGCLAPQVVQAAAEPVTGIGETFQAVFAVRRADILSEMRQAVGASATASEWAEQLLDAFSAELEGESAGTFLPTLDEILRQARVEGGDVAAWQGVLSTLRRQALACITDDEALSRAENLWQQSRVLVGDMAQRVQAHRRLQAEQWANVLREIGQSLVTAVDVEKLMDVLAEGLPRLDIPSCYLSLYEDPESPTEWVRLLLAYGEQGRIELDAGGLRFPSRQLVPGGMLPHDRPYSMVVEPLYFREDQLGLALFEVGPREGMVYDALRGQLSSALKGVLLSQQVARRALQIQTAAEVSRAASSILDPGELIQQVVDLAQERFDLYYAGLFLLDEAGEWAVLRAGTGEAGRQMVEQGHRLKVGGESMIGWCIANKEARIALDVGEEAVRFENPLLPETRSELALPLVSRGEAIGALTIQSAQEAAFSQEDIAVLQAMAGQVATALENARLFEQMQQRFKELASLNQLSASISAGMRVEELAGQVLMQLTELMEVHASYLALYDEENEEVEFVLDFVQGKCQRSENPRRKLGKGRTDHIIRSRQPLLLKGNIQEACQRLGIESSDQRARAFLGVPMVQADRVVGVLAVQSYEHDDAYEEHDLELLTTVAGQVAGVVERTRLLEQTQAALKEMEAIHRHYLGQAWAEYVQTAKKTGYETERPGVALLGDAVLPEIQQAVERQGTMVLGPLPQPLPGAEGGDQGRSRSALVAPIALRGQVIGALGIHDEDGVRQWTDDEIALVEAVAERMALAAENLRLLDETQRRAARERLTAEVTARMRETLDVESVLKTAVQEVRQALGLPEVVVRLAPQPMDESDR